MNEFTEVISTDSRTQIYQVCIFIHGRIILRGIFKKWEGVVGTGWSRLRIGTGGGHL
jgi:hypothetical protein